MVLLQNLDYSEEKLPGFIPRLSLSVLDLFSFQTFGNRQPRSAKKSQFCNYEQQDRYL